VSPTSINFHGFLLQSLALLFFFFVSFSLYINKPYVRDVFWEPAYRKSFIKPPGVLILFQAHLSRGGLTEKGGLFERRGGLFHLETTMVSVLHKELEYKVEKLKYKKF